MLFEFFPFRLQRNRLLIIPWLINSMVSLLFNGMGIVVTVIVSMQSNAPDYSSIIPFTVAAIIVFGNYDCFFRCLFGCKLERDVLLIDWLIQFYSLFRYLHLCLRCDFVIVRRYSPKRTKHRVHQLNCKP